MKYYNNDLTLPIFYEGKTSPCETKSIAELLTSKKIPTELIATATPVYVKSNVEFVVDTSYLGDWRDIKTDMIIGMVRSATKTFHFQEVDDQLISSNSETYDYKATRYVYVYKSYCDFHKVILAISKSSGDLLPLFYVQYYFEDGEHDISFLTPCHGNNLNKDKPRHVTSFSVRNKIKC